MFRFYGRKKMSMLSSVKFILTFVLIVLLTNIFLSSSMYASYKNHSLELAQNNAVEELSQLSYSTNFMFEAAKMTLVQLYSNPAALKLMNYDYLTELEAAALLQQVSIVNINLPFVNSIYIYNRNAEKIYFEGKVFPLDSFPDEDIVDQLKNTPNMDILKPLARKIPQVGTYTTLAPGREPAEEVYTFIFFEKQKEYVDNAIVLNVSQEWMKNTLDSMNPTISSETLVVDANGLITLGNGAYHYLDNIKDSFFIDDIMNDEKTSGHVIKNINEQDYLVSYVSSNVSDWKFIRLTPYDFVIGKLQRITLYSVFIFALVTVLSVMVVLFFSRNFYGIFSKRITELQRKFDMEKNAGYEKKQQYLKLLLTQQVDKSTMNHYFSRFKITLHTDKSLVAVVFKIARYPEYCEKYPPEDRELFTYGCINIINEIAANASFSGEAADLGEGLIGVLLNADGEENEDATLRLETMVKEIQSKTEEYLDMVFTVCIGDIVDDMGQVKESVDSCLEALDYRLFYEPRAVLYTSGIAEIKKKEYVFPEDAASGFIVCLLKGDREGAYGYQKTMIASTRGYSVNSLQTMLMQLIVLIKEGVKKHSLLAFEVSYEPFIAIISRITAFESLEDLETELQKHYDRMFDLLANSMEPVKKHEKYGELLEDVEKFLEKEYTNPNLDPERIAMSFGITSKYLRTIYRKASGEFLGDRINRYRLERAKSQLENTDAPVNDIAQSCGFMNINYFYTLFKKYNGITPNEFRSVNYLKKD